jgi:hypothetical protein
LYYLIGKPALKRLKQEITNDKIPIMNPSFIENLLGYFTLLVFISQIFYKSYSGQLVFILNPCHFVGLLESVILLYPSNLRQRILYTALMNTLFSPWIAIFFPVTLGLNAPFEFEMFWVEHILVALVNPLVLSLCNRYYTANTISVKNHIFAHICFGLWQRTVLFPLSQLTHANLNFTLCGAAVDPFEGFIGKWYYVFSEVYIFIGGEIFHRMIKLILDIIKQIKSFILQKKTKKE